MANDAQQNQSHDTRSAIGDFVARHRRTYQIIIWVWCVLGFGGTIAWATSWLDVRDAGYTGAFIVNLVGSAAVVVPVPGLFAVCAAATPEFGLNFLLLALAGAAGSTIGELSGYLAGYGSQGVAQRSSTTSEFTTML